MLNVEIDKSAIEAAVAKAIVDSAIGDKIRKAVNDLLSGWHSNPIDKALEEVVRQVAMQQVRELYAEKIAEAVKAKVTDEKIANFVDAFWDAAMPRK